MASDLFTNSSENTLFDRFTGILGQMKDLYAFYAVIGYFRSSGYFALQPFLTGIEKIKILVGINVDKLFADAQEKGLLFLGNDGRTKEELQKLFVEDIEEAAYTKEMEAGVIQFIEDMLAGKIEVRAHRSKNLHAKFYLFLPEHHSVHSDGRVIMGSSNLTAAGLGIKKASNYELNVELRSFADVKFARDEFDRLWEESISILPVDFQEFKDQTYIAQTFTPYELYLKFLIEHFGSRVDYDPNTVGDLPRSYRKLSYQIDAVNQGFEMLMQHDGFFLADVVGLGKTVVAAMIANRFRLKNGSDTTKILVVYPPALEKNWKSTFKEFHLDKHTKFITNGSLDKILEKSLDYWEKEDYDLILVDEAHRYRNHESRMFQNLQRICKSPRRSNGHVRSKKKVILISATPLNNRPADIYYQLQLFQDARRSTLTERNLTTFFGPIIRQFREVIRQPQPDLSQIQALNEKMRERVISPLTVRRTRNDLKRYPKYLEDLTAQGIAFPEIADPRSIEYELDGTLGALFVETMKVLTDDVKYHRYQAILHLKDSIRDKFYPQASLVSMSLAGIMRNLLVKRLESSFFAFKRSLSNVAKATERMIEMFDRDKVFIAPDFDVNSLMEKGYSIEEVENYILERTLGNADSRNRIFAASDFRDDLRTGLSDDLTLLNGLLERWKRIDEDPKLEKFLEALRGEFISPSINRTGKLVIFTESKDTANHLAEEIKARLGIEVLNVSADSRSKLFDTIAANFDANHSGEQKDDYKLLITTDVLAEGVNLHRANVIINYDTPWNATRLMQRIGRVNRIGSVESVIYSYNFYPSPQGNAFINLYNKSLVKLQAFHSAFGEDARIYSHEEFVDQFHLYKEGFEGEEDKDLIYLRQIREFKDAKPEEFKRIMKFPVKARVARSIKTTGKEHVKDSTVVFIRSDGRNAYYSVDEKGNISALSFLQAAETFEARPGEPGFSIPDHHYEHVRAAVDEFGRDVDTSKSKAVVTAGKADALSSRAKKFLRELNSLTKDEEVRIACEGLGEFIDAGVFAVLPKEVDKLRQEVNKKKLSWEQAGRSIVELSVKYDVTGPRDNPGPDNDEAGTSGPRIILSETFIP